jgi:protein TonB
MGLDEKAVEAITQWKFRPGTKDGDPVATQLQVNLNFRLL